MKIIEQFITRDTSYQNNIVKADSRYTRFQERGPIGLMLHSVGCNQPSAKVFADGWNKPGREASVHAVLQADGTVYQTMPWNFRAWHCGGAANDTHVGVEMTEPACINYPDGGSRFTCSDVAAARAQVHGTYNTAVELFAMLCEKFKLDPLKDIISHKEGCDKGIASNHGDPEHLWKGLSMGYTMDGFRKAVKKRMEDNDVTKEQVETMIESAITRAVTEAMQRCTELVDRKLDDALGPMIGDVQEIPWKGVREEVQEMVDLGVIDGGTSAEVNPNDVNMRLQLLRVLTVGKRFTLKSIPQTIKDRTLRLFKRGD